MENKFVPVMITPFDLKAKVDFDAVGALVDFYLQAGVKGFFANCLSSEMFSITEDERIALTAFVVKYVNGRVPVVATSSFGLTLHDKAEFTKKIYDTGIDAAILITGHFAKIDEDDIKLMQNFETFFELTKGIPLGMYECPAPYKRIITASVFKKLLAANRFVYHKDTSIRINAVKEKLEIIKSTNNAIEFFDAHTPNAMQSVQMGAKGLSSISGNFYPEILVWMVNNANNLNIKEDVEWLQSELTKVDAAIHIAYPMSAKYFMQKRGLPVRTISRATALQLTPEQKNELDNIYNSFLQWCERLNIEPVNMKTLSL